MAPSEQPERIPIVSVRLDPDHSSMIIIGDLNGQEWRYLQDHNGQLTLGYRYLISNGKYQVSLFIPLGPAPLPVLLDVKARAI